MIETSKGFIPSPDMGEQWLTAKEFARVLGCSPFHVRRIAADGLLQECGIPVYRIGHGRRTKIFIFTPTRML